MQLIKLACRSHPSTVTQEDDAAHLGLTSPSRHQSRGAALRRPPPGRTHRRRRRRCSSSRWPRPRRRRSSSRRSPPSPPAQQARRRRRRRRALLLLLLLLLQLRRSAAAGGRRRGRAEHLPPPVGPRATSVSISRPPRRSARMNGPLRRPRHRRRSRLWSVRLLFSGDDVWGPSAAAAWGSCCWWWSTTTSSSSQPPTSPLSEPKLSVHDHAAARRSMATSLSLSPSLRLSPEWIQAESAIYGGRRRVARKRNSVAPTLFQGWSPNWRVGPIHPTGPPVSNRIRRPRRVSLPFRGGWRVTADRAPPWGRRAHTSVRAGSVWGSKLAGGWSGRGCHPRRYPESHRRMGSMGGWGPVVGDVGGGCRGAWAGWDVWAGVQCNEELPRGHGFQGGRPWMLVPWRRK